jgi:hypothetical protein
MESTMKMTPRLRLLAVSLLPPALLGAALSCTPSVPGLVDRSKLDMEGWWSVQIDQAPDACGVYDGQAHAIVGTFHIRQSGSTLQLERLEGSAGLCAWGSGTLEGRIVTIESVRRFMKVTDTCYPYGADRVAGTAGEETFAGVSDILTSPPFVYGGSDPPIDECGPPFEYPCTATVRFVAHKCDAPYCGQSPPLVFLGPDFVGPTPACPY